MDSLCEDFAWSPCFYVVFLWVCFLSHTKNIHVKKQRSVILVRLNEGYKILTGKHMLQLGYSHASFWSWFCFSMTLCFLMRKIFWQNHIKNEDINFVWNWLVHTSSSLIFPSCEHTHTGEECELMCREGNNEVVILPSNVTVKSVLKEHWRNPLKVKVRFCVHLCPCHCSDKRTS